MIMSKPSQPSGVSLVLSLLVMGAIGAVAVALSILILNEVGTTKGINNAMVGFYTAEASVEQAMWLVREGRRLGQDIDVVAQSLVGSGNLGGPGGDDRMAWVRRASSSSAAITFSLRKDESAFFDLYNPVGGNPPRKMSLQCGDCTNGPNIEVSWVGWEPSQGFGGMRKSFPFLFDGSVWAIVFDQGTNPTRFRMQIRAFDAEASNLTFRIYDINDPPSEILIPSQIEIEVSGTFPSGSSRSATQAIRANVPWLLPVSGLYSYVLFSEAALAK